MEVEIFFQCPYCIQQISMLFEESSELQTYVEDCEVCCRPIQLTSQDGKVIRADRAQ